MSDSLINKLAHISVTKRQIFFIILKECLRKAPSFPEENFTTVLKLTLQKENKQGNKAQQKLISHIKTFQRMNFSGVTWIMVTLY